MNHRAFTSYQTDKKHHGRMKYKNSACWLWKDLVATVNLLEGGRRGHVHTITPSQLTSCINKGSFSSCMSVPSSTFTTIASFPSQRDVWHVSLQESGTSFGKSVQFCKTTTPLSVIILICHYTLSTQLFCSILYSSSSLRLLEVY